MDVRALSIAETWVVTTPVHGDDRGAFTEWWRPADVLAATGRRFEVAQANRSTSSRGVVRGLHYADVPPGQAKWVSCAAGAVLDVVVDIRVGSPTYGRVETVELTDGNGVGLLIGEGLAHGFCALTDTAVLTYLVTSPYTPSAEHGLHPYDPELAIDWPVGETDAILSPRDAAAPTLTDARDAHPTWAGCQAFYATQRA